MWEGFQAIRSLCCFPNSYLSSLIPGSALLNKPLSFGSLEHLVNPKLTVQDGEFWWAVDSGMPALNLFSKWFSVLPPGAAKAPAVPPTSASLNAKVLENFLTKSRQELLECEYLLPCLSLPLSGVVSLSPGGCPYCSSVASSLQVVAVPSSRPGLGPPIASPTEHSPLMLSCRNLSLQSTLWPSFPHSRCGRGSPLAGAVGVVLAQ